MEKEKTIKKVKENLETFEEIWQLEANLKDYTRSGELSNIAAWLLSQKLSDKFLIEELSDKEQITFSNAMIIALTKKN